MERYTKEAVLGTYVQFFVGEGNWQLTNNGGRYTLSGDVVSRLAAYEDTRLTPAQIEALKAENERLFNEKTSVIMSFTKQLQEKQLEIIDLRAALTAAEERAEKAEAKGESK